MLWPRSQSQNSVSESARGAQQTSDISRFRRCKRRRKSGTCWLSLRRYCPTGAAQGAAEQDTILAPARSRRRIPKDFAGQACNSSICPGSAAQWTDFSRSGIHPRSAHGVQREGLFEEATRIFGEDTLQPRCRTRSRGGGGGASCKWASRQSGTRGNLLPDRVRLWTVRDN